MPEDAQLFDFETYLKDRERRTLCPIEKAGTEAALDRCRMLVDRIASDLHEKKSEHFVNILSLAEFHASLERAASVLGICGESQDQVTYPRISPDRCDDAVGFSLSTEGDATGANKPKERE